jgi:hypothetical protein
MSTKTDFYIGRGDNAEWLGSLQWDCDLENLLRVAPGRLALTATDETTYRDAIADLFTIWELDELGLAHPRRTGWPWPWHTSHVSSWIVTFDPADIGVFVTVGGGVRWERIDHHTPHEPGTDDMQPPDIEAWLRAPASSPSVPLPLMRDPNTGRPTIAGQPPPRSN